MPPLRLLLSFAAPHRRALAAVAGLMLLDALASLAVPWMAGLLARQVASGSEGAGGLVAGILAVLATMALLRYASNSAAGTA